MSPRITLAVAGRVLLQVRRDHRTLAMLLVLAAALILSGVLARRLSKRIVDPLNRLDLDHPLHSGSYEELAPLLGRINQQHREISSQLRTLRRKTDEFDQITGSMKEGLVLLDNAGVVLSINPAAQRLYGVSRASVGQDFLTVDRSRDMSCAIADAVKPLIRAASFRIENEVDLPDPQPRLHRVTVDAVLWTDAD